MHILVLDYNHLMLRNDGVKAILVKPYICEVHSCKIVGCLFMKYVV